MDEIKKYLSRRISHASKRVTSMKERHGDNPTSNYTYYGGQSLGYWEGTLSAYENVLDEINELEKQ